MGSILPILFVIIFWIIVGIIACMMFGRWLKLPPEGEFEVHEEVAHNDVQAAQPSIEAKAAH